MQGITIQILSLNNNTPFGYIFAPFLKLNNSMRKTHSNHTTALITFLIHRNFLFCIHKHKSYLARITSCHVVLKVQVERQINFLWEK